MALPVFTFNDSSGSDSQASGAGPATAVFGTSASYSGSVFTLDGTPDLSGVLTDGSHVIWVQTSTGRQFFTINAVDDGADTVTVDDAPAGTTTGLTWGLGGKRNNIGQTQSALLFSADGKAGWIIELEDNQSIGAAITVSTEPLIVQSTVAGTKRTITQTADAGHFSIGNTYSLRCKDLTFHNTAGTKGGANPLLGGGTACAVDCIFGDATNTIEHAAFNIDVSFLNCEIRDCTSHGVSLTSSSGNFVGCWIHDNGGHGIYVNSGDLSAVDCLITDNTTNGIHGRPGDIKLVVNCTIHSNTADGIDFTLVGAAETRAMIVNNNITANVYGIDFPANQDTNNNGCCIEYNNFGTGATANSSGDVDQSLMKGENNLAVDPEYTATGSNDYSIGTNLKEAGAVDPAGTIGAGQSGTTTYVDIGCAQRQEPAGGGVAIPNTRRNSMIGR